MSRDSQRYRKTYSYYRVQPKTELLEVIVDETLDWKHSVRAASTASVSLTGSTPLTIDDVTLADEDRVLLKDQGSGAENGIYYFEVSNGSYTLTRASDARQGTISCGATTYAEEGTVNSGKIFIMSTTGPITVGTTAMSWTLFSGAGSGVGGSGTANYVSKFTASNTLGNSSIYDDSAGIGIGTTSFSGRFFVSGSASVIPTVVIKGGYASLFDVQNFSGTSILFATGTLGTVGGRVGIGTSQPDAKFQVSSSYGGSAHGISIGKPNFLGLASNAYTSLQHNFYGGDGTTQRMMIDSAGNTIFGGAFSGLTANTARLFVTGSSTSTDQGIVYKSGVASPTGPLLDIKNHLGNSIIFVSGSGLSGSLTKLTDGTSYLIAGSNVTITTGSNGAVTIESSGVGGSGTTNFIPKFTAGSTLGDSILQEGLGVNYTGAPNTAFLTSSGYGITFTQPQIWSFEDSAFGLNIDGKFKFDTSGGGSLGIGTPSTPGQKLHIVISEPSTDSPFVSDAPRVIRLQNSNTTANNSTSIVNADGSGGDINSFIQFINVDHSSDKGALAFGTRDGASSGVRMKIDEAGNVGIGSIAPSSIGTDVFLFVSGSSGSLGTSTRGVAAFGGDVIVSGSLKVGTGSVLLTSNNLQFGGSATRIEKVGNDLKFFDLNNASGKTLAEIAAASPSYFTSTVNDTVYTTGSVGIGTTTVRSKLHVFGNGQTTAAITDAGDRGSFIRISHNDNTQGSGGGILFTNYQGDNANSVGFAAIKGLLYDGSENTTGDLAVSTRSSTSSTSLTERLRITRDGKLGIGTTSPNAVLDVSKSSGAVDIRLSNGGTTYMNLYAGSGVGAVTLLAVQSEPLVLGTDNTEKMRIDSSGNVGIGTVTPITNVGYRGLTINGTSGATLSHMVNGSEAFRIQSDASAHSLIGISVVPVVIKTNNTEAVRVDTSGNVGIGTSTINARLDILSSDGDEGVIVRQGTTAPASATPILQVKGYDGGTVLWVSGSSTHGARVGIGTTNPRSICMLDVGSKGSTGTNNYVNVEASSTGECGYSWTAGGANPLWKFSRAASTSNISLIEQGSSNVALLCEYSTGNVGIGTSSISARLHVSGSGTGTTTTLMAKHGVANGSSLPVLDVQNSTGNSLLYVSGSGFVGIGTSTASSVTNLLKSLGGNVLSIAGPSASSLLFEVNGNLSGSISTSNSGMTVVPGANRTLGLGSDNGVKLTIDTEGDVNLQASDRYFDASIASGQGIKLRSTPGNSDAQVLDAYYEADLSSGIDCTGNEGNGVYVLDAAYDTLKMTRVGRLVTIGGDLRIDSLGDTPSGRLFINLGTSAGQYPSMDTAASVYVTGAIDLSGAVATSIQAYVASGGGRMYVDGYLNGSKVDIATQVGAGVTIKISVTYSV